MQVLQLEGERDNLAAELAAARRKLEQQPQQPPQQQIVQGGGSGNVGDNGGGGGGAAQELFELRLERDQGRMTAGFMKLDSGVVGPVPLCGVCGRLFHLCALARLSNLFAGAVGVTAHLAMSLYAPHVPHPPPWNPLFQTQQAHSSPTCEAAYGSDTLWSRRDTGLGGGSCWRRAGACPVRRRPQVTQSA